MLKINQTADIVQLVDCYDTDVNKGRIIFWALSGAMTEQEYQDKDCTQILVSSEAKKLIDKFLPLVPKSESFIEDDVFMGAKIIVSEELENHVPKGLAEEVTK